MVDLGYGSRKGTDVMGTDSGACNVLGLGWWCYFSSSRRASERKRKAIYIKIFNPQRKFYKKK